MNEAQKYTSSSGSSLYVNRWSISLSQSSLFRTSVNREEKRGQEYAELENAQAFK